MEENNGLSRRDAFLRAIAGVGVIGAGALLMRSKPASADESEDRAVLKALIRAERNALATYVAGAGVIDGAPTTDPLYAFRGIVKAVALHFHAQHTDHEAKLVKYLTTQGGTDDVGAGMAQIPTGFVGNIKNVIDLASNAEKAAAIAYTDVQKSLTLADNAELAAAIGSDETQHYVVLQLLARGLVVPPMSVANMDATALAATAAKFAARSFTVTIDGVKGLDDSALAYYDVTT